MSEGQSKVKNSIIFCCRHRYSFIAWNKKLRPKSMLPVKLTKTGGGEEEYGQFVVEWPAASCSNSTLKQKVQPEDWTSEKIVTGGGGGS